MAAVRHTDKMSLSVKTAGTVAGSTCRPICRVRKASQLNSDFCAKEKKKAEDREWGVYSLSSTAVAVTEQVDQLYKKKRLLECQGRRLLTFSPLFSYQMLGRKKKRQTRECVVGETWALTQPLSNPIATLARWNVNVMRICLFFNLQIANGAF